MVARLGCGSGGDDEHATVHRSGGTRHAGLRMRGGCGGGRYGPGGLCKGDDMQARFNRRPCAARSLPMPSLLSWPARHEEK